MKHLHFEPETDGFYGAYWESKSTSDTAMIAMLGDDPEDYMCKTCVKWLHTYGINVMSMSPGKKNYSHHNYPLERIGSAIEWLKAHGNKKIGIVGASTTATVALVAASYYHDLTLTVALTPSDFVWQGFAQGKRDGCKEWPVENESIVSIGGKPVPFMPFVYKHPEYWQKIAKASKEHGDSTYSKDVFDDSEAAGLLKEEHFIPVENIGGKLVLVGAEDDSLWDTAKYIRRMDSRLKSRPHSCKYSVYLYEHGTHFVFPESVLKKALPVGADMLVNMCFSAAKKFPAECKAMRLDLDKKLSAEIIGWKSAK